MGWYAYSGGLRMATRARIAARKIERHQLIVPRIKDMLYRVPT